MMTLRPLGEYRPISISNAYCRLFHRLMAKRLAQRLPLHRSQKAFRKVDGTAANLAILQTAMREAKRRVQGLFLAFIDLRKAFDSVAHQTILRVALEAGIPPHFCEYLRAYYAQGSTLLYGARIQLVNGVRQGDPLSPVLFNLIVRETLIRAEGTGVGFRMCSGYLLQTLAFADDLVLFASSKRGLQTSTDEVLAWLAKAGLRANPGKCATLAIIADGRNKRALVDKRPCLQIDGEDVPGMKPSHLYKYLGVKINAAGKAQTPEARLRLMLANLRRAPLKPQQRMHILKNHLIPKIVIN